MSGHKCSHHSKKFQRIHVWLLVKNSDGISDRLPLQMITRTSFDFFQSSSDDRANMKVYYLSFVFGNVWFLPFEVQSTMYDVQRTPAPENREHAWEMTIYIMSPLVAKLVIPTFYSLFNNLFPHFYFKYHTSFLPFQLLIQYQLMLRLIWKLEEN